MREGSIDLIQGCREFLALRIDDQVAPSALAVFTAVESETDNYPLGELRRNFSSDLLTRLDEEVLDYLSKVRPALMAACSDILGSLEGFDQ